MEIPVYLGLGSNLGDRQGNIARALALLEPQGVHVLRTSPLYETEPWGVTDQPRFLNAACAAQTNLGPFVLLDALKAIERALGRVETVRWGPRTIDLDILLYDALRLDTPRLTIPHAGMLQRATVLVPLHDIAPNLRHPITQKTMSEHLTDLGLLRDIALYPPGLAQQGNAQTTNR